MTRSFKTFAAIAALAIGISAPAFAQSQLIASAGLTPDEARGMTLNQIAAAKYNRDGTSYADRQGVVIEPGSADHSQLAASVGLSPSATLNEIAAVKYNEDGTSYADRQIVKRAGATMASRSVAGDTGRWSQLIASAGLSREEAAGMTLNQIVAAKYNRDGTSYSDRQRVYE